MRLRKLQQKDAPFMLEWMHDETVVKNMQTDFFVKTIEDCKAFIAASHEEGLYWHRLLELIVRDESLAA